jgi:predicted Zn finger-like uncharacterized protein
MIITCPHCKKQFKINPTLIPTEGRDLECGSCGEVWFYKVEEESTAPLKLNKDVTSNESRTNLVENDKEEKIIKNQIPLNTDKKTKKTGNKFFSYLVIFIISFVALIILVDTLKTPLINIFPGLEIILFNLFETLQDIKLFIIDLS